MQGQTARVCTTPFLRVSRHRNGACSASRHGPLRPRNISVPSDRPTQKQGCRGSCGSECQVRVRGSTRQPSGTLAVLSRRGAGVQSHAQGQDKAPIGAWAVGDAVEASLQSPVTRLVPSGPSEAAGAPAPLSEPWRQLSLANPVSRRDMA